jgi:hypothetical protein
MTRASVPAFSSVQLRRPDNAVGTFIAQTRFGAVFRNGKAGEEGTRVATSAYAEAVPAWQQDYATQAIGNNIGIFINQKRKLTARRRRYNHVQHDVYK